MSLTKIGTEKAFQSLFDSCFTANSLLDNCVYALEKELRLPKFADFIHKNIAHFYPNLADKIQEFALKRGVRIVRGAVIAHDKVYLDPIACLQDVYNYFLEIEKNIDNAINISISEMDKTSEDFFRHIGTNIQPNYTFQISQFIEALKFYDEDNILASFNSGFEDFITLN
jgi:ferritin